MRIVTIRLEKNLFAYIQELELQESQIPQNFEHHVSIIIILIRKY